MIEEGGGQFRLFSPFFLTFTGKKPPSPFHPLHPLLKRLREQRPASRVGQLEVKIDGVVVVEEVQLSPVRAVSGVVTREVSREVQVCAGRGWFKTGGAGAGKVCRRKRSGEHKVHEHKVHETVHRWFLVLAQCFPAPMKHCFLENAIKAEHVAKRFLPAVVFQSS